MTRAPDRLRNLQVRAGSLQELVYKQGQAGVTKASVSIVFNNSDASRSPVGYEHCEQLTVTRQARPTVQRTTAFAEPDLHLRTAQIVIGGRNKYLINGHVAQPRCGRRTRFRSARFTADSPPCTAECRTCSTLSS